MLQRALDIQTKNYGAQSAPAVATRTLLAGNLLATGRLEAALPLLESAVDVCIAQLGPLHPDVALAQCRLASCLHDLARCLPTAMLRDASL